jgi:murein DD-endopeptidase MepM/ murein hydrolase activator NlpD
MRNAALLVPGRVFARREFRACLALAALSLLAAGCATDGQSDLAFHSFSPRQQDATEESFYTVDLPDIPVGIPPREGFVWPIEHPEMYISSGFGHRRSSGGSGRLHKGVDMVCPKGTPIRAAANGKVTSSERSGAYGELIVIEHEGNMSTAYSHLTDRFVEAGTDILQGDIIGTVGDTGNASTNHLHYEVRVGGQAINPDQYLSGCETFYR